MRWGKDDDDNGAYHSDEYTEAKGTRRCNGDAPVAQVEDAEKDEFDAPHHQHLSLENEILTTNSSSWCTCSWHYLVSHWKILLGGQILSFLLATAGAAQATLHMNCGLSAPTFTMSLVYFFLSFHWVLIFWRRRHYHKQSQEQEHLQEEEEDCHSSYWGFGLSLQRPFWQYLIIAFLDVQANAVTVLAYRYTTLTSVTLFDALAIPSAIVVSKLFLGRQYTRVHLLGIILCMTGVICNVMQDYESDHEHHHQQVQDPTGQSNVNSSTISSAEFASNTTTLGNDPASEYPYKVRGDLLAITGGILFGVNDVLSEATMRHNGETAEYLGVMGLFAFAISLTQALVLEWQEILEFFGRAADIGSDMGDDSGHATCSLSTSWALLFVFVGVTVIGYMGGSNFLLISEAAFFNLSLLTGDLWSVAFSVVAERITPQPLFFGSLLFVMSGVILYEMAPSPVVEDNINRTYAASNVRLSATDHDAFGIQRNGEVASEEDPKIRELT